MKYIDLDTLSNNTSLSVYTLRLYCKKNGMPHYKVGRKILIDPDEFDLWFKQYKTVNKPVDCDLKQLVNSTMKKLGIHPA